MEGGRKELIMADKMIISIGRQCGSGGHEIGKKLAEHYGINFYDKEIIQMLAEKTNQEPEELAKVEEKVTGHFFHKEGGFAASQDLMGKMTKSDQMYLQEKALIESLAEKESFVVVGRGANGILANDPNTLHIHVFADEAFKAPRVMEQYGLSDEKEAMKKMAAVDKARRDYFNFYSGNAWGSTDTHDVMINSGVFGIDGTVDIIINIADRKFGKEN